MPTKTFISDFIPGDKICVTRGKLLMIATRDGFSSFVIGKYCNLLNMPDNTGVDPNRYMVMVYEDGRMCIVNRPFIRTTRLMVGHKVHLKSIQGIYEVTQVELNQFTVTCKNWQHESDPSKHTRTVPMDDLKCLAGGFYNDHHKSETVVPDGLLTDTPFDPNPPEEIPNEQELRARAGSDCDNCTHGHKCTTECPYINNVTLGDLPF